MISGIITIRTKEVEGGSPTGYDILLETRGACGCEYACSYVSYAHDSLERLEEMAPYYKQLETSLHTDRHGDQLAGGFTHASIPPFTLF